MSIDLVIINPSAAHGIQGGHPVYGELGDTLIAVEPPQWCRILAGYAIDRGYSVRIIDAEALRIDPAHVALVVQEYAPTLTCIAVYGHQPSASTQQMFGARQTADALQCAGIGPLIIVGGHPSALPERTLREEPVAYVCKGEGPETVVQLLEALKDDDPPLRDVQGLVWRDGERIVVNKAAPLLDINALHGDAWELLPMHLYRAHNWQCFSDIGKRQPYASIFTSLGCPYSCLAGDTLVNTLYGNFPIRELAEKFGDAGIPVYTYDPETRRTLIADGVRIRRYGINKPLVRVAFDDGTHLDVTPDHQFLQFGWGNGRRRSKSWQEACRADELPNGAHVRAMRLERHPTGRNYVTWGRRDRNLRSRMVMEYLLGRGLRRTEHVHHVDHDVSNDHPANLLYCRSAKEHAGLHPEFAERMRQDNPTKNGMSQEWIDRISDANKGKVRSVEARLRYRSSKLGEKNPNYKHGKRCGTASRVEVNHRVVSVTPLDECGDVYCLTVPKTGWFFANNVLVKNCHFCCINSPFDSHRYRMRDPDAVVREIKYLHDKYGVSTFKITDEMFVLNARHYTAIAEGLIHEGLGEKLNIWCYSRADTIRPDRLNLLRRAGVRWVALGIESGSKFVMEGTDKRLKPHDIADVVDAIQRAGINVIGNFIVGLYDDTHETMRETLDLAKSLRLDFMNIYSAQAYPGSPLYDEAIEKGWKLPSSWSGYSQHNKWARPLDTEHLSGAEVLKFRDEAFLEYYSDPSYIDRITQKFGVETAAHTKEMLRYRLDRLLLQPSYPTHELEMIGDGATKTRASTRAT